MRRLKVREGVELIDTCKFRFCSLEQALDLAGFLAVYFPDPEPVLPGLAELLITAVQHGNIEIRHEGEVQLSHDGRLQDEIERRLTLPEYKDRHVDVVLKRREDGLCVVITDGGRGFEWKNYLKIDPARASDSKGRGIAQATIVSFDRVVSNAVGNQVVGFVSAQTELDW